MTAASSPLIWIVIGVLTLVAGALISWLMRRRMGMSMLSSWLVGLLVGAPLVILGLQLVALIAFMMAAGGIQRGG